MKTILLALITVILLASLGYCQDTQGIARDIAKLYNNNGGAGNNLIAGLSMGKLIGGFLFSSIGFIAFIYGKRTTKFKPLIIGMILIGYPYFVKSTIAMYLLGITLTAVLFIWRE